MKILMATFGFYPATIWGGPVAVVYQGASELQRRGYEITICASNRLDKKNKIASGSFEREYNGLRVVYLNTHLIGNWPGTVGPTLIDLYGLQYLWSEVRAVDVVHVHGTRNMISMTAVLYARIQGKPIVIQPHGTLPHVVNSIRFKSFYDKLFMRRILGSAKKIIALQMSEFEQIIQAGGDPKCIKIVPNGLDNTGYNADNYRGLFRDKFSIPNDRKIILFLGRINKKKGVDFLVEAYTRLSPETRKNTILVIAGPDDGQMREIQTLVNNYSINDEVLITGLLQGDEVKSAYVDADIFVLPCRVDTFPMAIIEACQAGTPIIVTETCEIAEYLNGKAAKVVPVDIDAITNSIQDLLEDAEIYRNYQQGAKVLMDSVFSIQAVGDKLEMIYQDIG